MTRPTAKNIGTNIQKNKKRSRMRRTKQLVRSAGSGSSTKRRASEEGQLRAAAQWGYPKPDDAEDPMMAPLRL